MDGQWLGLNTTNEQVGCSAGRGVWPVQPQPACLHACMPAALPSMPARPLLPSAAPGRCAASPPCPLPAPCLCATPPCSRVSRVRTHTHIHTHTQTQTNIHARAHTHTHNTHTCAHTHTHPKTHMHICALRVPIVPVCAPPHPAAEFYTCAHAHTRMHRQTYTHTSAHPHTQHTTHIRTHVRTACLQFLFVRHLTLRQSLECAYTQTNAQTHMETYTHTHTQAYTHTPYTTHARTHVRTACLQFLFVRHLTLRQSLEQMVRTLREQSANQQIPGAHGMCVRVCVCARGLGSGSG